MNFYRISLISVALWEEELIVFNHASGNTHLLNNVFLQLFKFCLNQSVVNPVELYDYCRKLSGLENKRLVDSFIKELSHLDILQKIECEDK